MIYGATLAVGNALGLLATEVITLTAQEILKHTLLSALLSALAWPMALTRLGYLIDNPWSIALDRAKLAGLVLADSLLMRSYLGFRPVTLVCVEKNDSHAITAAFPPSLFSLTFFFLFMCAECTRL